MFAVTALNSIWDAEQTLLQVKVLRCYLTLSVQLEMSVCIPVGKAP